MIEGAKQRTVASGKVRLSVLEAGDPGRPTLLFVHGYPDTKELWEPIMSRLAPGHHVVAYDLRGAGKSSTPRGAAAYDFNRLGDDLLAVIEAVAPAGDVHLVGHDWGGIQGWEFAADPRFDGKLASLTTIAGPSLDQVTEELRAQLRGGHLLWVAGAVRRSWYVLALCTPGVPTLAWRGALGRGWWAWLLVHRERIAAAEGYPTHALAPTGVHLANLYRRNILWRLPRAGAARSARVPVQLIVPGNDHFISPRYYARAADRAPQLRRRTVAGSHWSPRAQPELLSRWIEEFALEAGAGEATSSRPWVPGGGREQLRDRLALVTGAGSGIGRATALALADHGARLLLVDRDGDAGARTAEVLADAHAYACDVGEHRAMEQLVAEVISTHGVPDIVVNNAGIAVAGSFLDTGFDDWRRVIDVNLMGVVHGSRLFGRAMIERGEGGQIVNIASAAAFAPTKDLSAYAASKAAVLMLSECLRAELSPFGIGVTAVCPGFVATNITRSTRYVGHAEAEQARLQELMTRLYQRRNFTPERVAAEIVAAIAADTAVAVVTPEAKVMRALSRFAPGALRRLAAIDALPI